MKALWNDLVLAESDETLVVEGNHYFPPEAVNMEHFASSEHTTVCSWKGEASYLNAVQGESLESNVAWYYSEPSDSAAQIKDHVAFWKGVTVVT